MLVSNRPLPLTEPPVDAEPIRVLVLFGNIPLYGKERADIQLFDCLQDAGVDALFVTHDEYGHESIQPALDERGLAWTTASWADRFSLKLSPLGWAKRAWETVRSSYEVARIAAAYRPTHVFISTMRHYLSLWPALLVMRVPLVWHVCDQPEADHSVIRRLWRHVIVPRVARFVCVSHFIKRELLRVGALEAKAEVIYDLPMDRQPATADSALDIEPFDGYTLSYVGQLTPQKGIDALVEAALALCGERNDVRFLLAGDYSWNNPYARGLIESVEAAGFTDRIHFLGYVEDIPGLLTVSDLHVCPSRYQEPLGLVVVEAKQAGTPSVVFPSGGLVELVTHGEDGYVCAAPTVEALSASIAEALTLGKAGLERMGHTAQASLERLGFDRPSFTHAWRRVFDRVREPEIA